MTRAAKIKWHCRPGAAVLAPSEHRPSTAALALPSRLGAEDTKLQQFVTKQLLPICPWRWAHAGDILHIPRAALLEALEVVIEERTHESRHFTQWCCLVSGKALLTYANRHFK